MNQSLRQSNLFAAEDWRRLYRAFTQVNFNAYDFNSIKLALVEYLRRNYPEDFNDYIDSSEFIAIVDMIAYLGQSLAFRMDMNSQENFIDTAHRRESILKLARMLSYKPKRNIASRGLVKIMSVRTNDDIYDSNAVNINGTDILWNDPNNPDWFEQFTLVMNNVFVSSNPFGQPIEKATIGSIKSHIYRLNNTRINNTGQYSFNANVEGSYLPFELINVFIQDQTFYQERSPDSNAAFHLIYQNDGNGNQSKNTGFFAYFKQGDLKFVDHNIVTPIENRIINYDTANINEYDVWVQTINEAGQTLVDWVKVPALETNNVIYNDVAKNIRDVFTVQTQPDNKIAVRFGDGRFSNVPTGLIRCWHRVSANKSLTIRPQDIRNININIPYLNKNGLEKRFSMVISLQETVSNSQPSETDEEIRRRAPQIYYTQNRMVSGEDYNVFALDDSTISKVKAINRTYSGHSRFIDINDPTGQHQNTNVFADDGLIYREYDANYTEVQITEGISPDEIINRYIQPFLKEEEFKNFIYGTIRQEINLRYADDITVNQPLFWRPASTSPTDSSGVLINLNETVEPIGSTTTGFKRFIVPGAMLKFSKSGWVGINEVSGVGNTINSDGQGSIVLIENVAAGDEVIAIMPKIRTSFNQAELDEIRQALVNENTFAIMYDFTKDQWFVRDTNSGAYSTDNPSYIPTKETDSDQTYSWIQLIEFKGSSENPFWAITNRGLRYVFESEEDVRFFFLTDARVVNRETGLLARDHVTVSKVNGRPEYEIAKLRATNWVSGRTAPIQYKVGQFVKYDSHYYICIRSHIAASNGADDYELWAKDFKYWRLAEGYLPEDIQFNLDNTFVYEDGHVEPRRVLLSYTDKDQDGMIDNPEVFDALVFGQMTPTLRDPRFYIHFERYTSFDGYDYYRPKLDVKWFLSESAMWDDYNNSRSVWSDGDVVYIWDPDTNNEPAYWDLDIDRSQTGDPLFEVVTDPTKYTNYVGRAKLDFQWKHYAVDDHRIDPAITNIVDMYVLSKDYDYMLRQWVLNGGTIDKLPEPQSIEQLRLTYSHFEQFKMISDQIVWHPVKYKLLFGSRADEEYRARIKVTKLSNATLSDGEIKASVITAINKYFSIDNWDFGDVFYFSELAAFIHQELATQVGGVVLVPLNQEARFGDLYDIRSASDEIFISSATVSDVEIVTTFTETILRVNE